MPILIDGHNLIGQLPMLSLRDPNDEEQLVGLLRSYQARTGKEITVIFDHGGVFALPTRRHHGRVEVLFAPYGSTADGVIARRVRRSRNPRGLVVVTSDRDLADKVTRHGARVRSSGAFASELINLQDAQAAQHAWKENPPSSDEVEAWLAMFGDRD
jgi:predicted RNA-binding protein with PIN domain